MKETIEQIVDIDQKSKKIIDECEQKEDNLENYITIELEKRKAQINAKYKYKINFLKTEYDKELKQKKEEIQKATQQIIEKIQNEYQQNKENEIKKIMDQVLRINAK